MLMTSRFLPGGLSEPLLRDTPFLALRTTLVMPAHSLFPPAFSAALIEAASVCGPDWLPVRLSMNPP